MKSLARSVSYAGICLCVTTVATAESDSSADSTAEELANQTPEIAAAPMTPPDSIWTIKAIGEGFWYRARAFEPDDATLWSDALAKLEESTDTSCSFTKWTAPRRDAEAALPRYIADAMDISLVKTLPRWLRLSVWFDTPVVAQRQEQWFKEGYDPTAGEPWSLLEVNSQPPTEKELYDHRAEKLAGAAAVRRVENHITKKGGEFTYVKHPVAFHDTLAKYSPRYRLYADDDVVVVGSDGQLDSDDLLSSNTRATFTLLRHKNRIAAFDIQGEVPFSPHPGLKVLGYRKTGSVDYDPNVNKYVLNYLEQSYSVKLTMVFDQAIEHQEWFGDFDCQQGIASNQ